MKWMKSILHTIVRELRLMEWNLKYRGRLTAKEDYLINRFVSLLQYRNSDIQLPEH